MASTREKMQAVAAELREIAGGEVSTEMQPMVDMVQIAAGFGIDVFEWLIPGGDAECDLYIDKLLALFLRVRGDDLPPFDPNLYGEAIVNDAEPS